MSGFFSKLLGLFVERIPVDEQGRPVQRPVPPPRGAAPSQNPVGPPGAPAPQPPHAQYPQQGPPGLGVPAAQHPPGQYAQQAMPQHPPQAQSPQAQYPQPQHQPQQSQQPQQVQGVPVGGSVAPSPAAPTLAVALRANVPEEYAAHLAPYGLHVLAAGADVTSDQARGWGAQVLVISAECLGRELHLLQTPQLPTVFIAPQPVMIPEQPGVVQVHEPLHASDVARAVRDALQAWNASGRSATN